MTFDEAQGRFFERAAVSAKAAGDADTEGTALHNYGDRLFNVGRYEESLAFLTRAAAVYEAAKATVDPGTVYNSVGRVYQAHGRHDEALNIKRRRSSCIAPPPTRWHCCKAFRMRSRLFTDG